MMENQKGKIAEGTTVWFLDDDGSIRTGVVSEIATFRDVETEEPSQYAMVEKYYNVPMDRCHSSEEECMEAIGSEEIEQVKEKIQTVVDLVRFLYNASCTEGEMNGCARYAASERAKELLDIELCD